MQRTDTLRAKWTHQKRHKDSIFWYIGFTVAQQVKRSEEKQGKIGVKFAKLESQTTKGRGQVTWYVDFPLILQPICIFHSHLVMDQL